SSAVPPSPPRRAVRAVPSAPILWGRSPPRALRLLMYERRHERLLPLDKFLWRMAGHVALGAAVVALSLLVGILGYVHFEHLGFLDGFLNAAMLLGGMGPLESPQTRGGKVFAG